MRHSSRLLFAATLLVALLAASPLWAAVTIKPLKAVAAKGATVKVAVAFSGETAQSLVVDVEVVSDPAGIITGLTGDGATIALKSGKGKATVTFKVPANPGAATREATLTINGAEVKVTQLGQPCKIAIAPTKSTLEFFGGEGRFAVNVAEGCPWSAEGQAGWLTMVAGSGTGSGEAIYRADLNTGKKRSGRIVVSGTQPGSNAKVAGKTHTVSQQEQKFAGTVKLGTPTVLDTPEKGAKAYRSVLFAAESVAFVNESLGSLGGIADLGLDNEDALPFNPVNENLGSLGGVADLGLNTGDALLFTGMAAVAASVDRLQPAMAPVQAAVLDGDDISGQICTGGGSAAVDGLKFDSEGNLTAIPKAITLTFDNCVVEGERLNGVVTAKGISVDMASGKVAATITVGQSATEPLQIVGPEMNASAFLTIGVSIPGIDGPLEPQLVADGFIDISEGVERNLVEMKGAKVSAFLDEGLNRYTTDGLFRLSTFRQGLFQNSFEMLFDNFSETIEADGNILWTDLEGGFAILNNPSDTCIDGTFYVETVKPIKAINGVPVEGELRINDSQAGTGAAIDIMADGRVRILTDSQSRIFYPLELPNICSDFPSGF